MLFLNENKILKIDFFPLHKPSNCTVGYNIRINVLYVQT